MSNRLKIEITVEYEDNVTERDRLEVDHQVDELLQIMSFSTKENAVADGPDAVGYTVNVVKAEIPRGMPL